MSKNTNGQGRMASHKAPFQVKPVKAGQVASIVLEELSRDYGDVCNFLEAAHLARKGELFLALTSVQEQLKRCTVVTPRQQWVYSQAESVLKKCYDPAVDPWSDTIRTWWSTERRCELLNRKFAAVLDRRASGEKVVPFACELYRFYEAIAYVLGQGVPVADIAESAYYGPGSSTGVRGRDVNFVRKVENNECVPLAIEYAAQALLHDKAAWAHMGMDPTYSHVESAREGFLRVARERLREDAVRHDRLMFIFKSMTSHRSIGAQPTVSGMLQLGFHEFCAQRLKDLAGIDLADQSWNGELARRGSLGWRDADPFCTLDKSNASNLIANGLVQYCFPSDWSKFLQRIRTPGYEAPKELGGGLHDYQMYAGMGNGTTFCVETLIFWAATYATQELTLEDYTANRQYAVYGDDVILRRSHAIRYMRFARFLGFRFNEKKTFIDGPFRESCGYDWFGGVPVRAATLVSENGLLDLVKLVAFHNNLADNKVFPLKGACARIRQLTRTHLHPTLPTDPQGNLGFRPVDSAGYDIVRTRAGEPVISSSWQRPRYYVMQVKPRFGGLEGLDAWTQFAVALLRARQSPQGDFSLPIRDLVTYRVVAEQDLNRKDLVLMLRNQLQRLEVRKQQPWWESHRGLESAS